MALIVEDGTVVAGADSYVSLAVADAYHASRGITLWATMSEAEREQAIRRATDYMVQAYRQRWEGTRVSSVQSLDWPRNWVKQDDYAYISVNGATTIGGFFYYPANEVPLEVQNACAELAYRGAAGPLLADETKQQRAIREKVDVIEVEFAAWTPTKANYRAVEAMLSPFLKSSGGGACRSLIRS
jgi:hypothetical protein